MFTKNRGKFSFQIKYFYTVVSHNHLTNMVDIDDKDFEDELSTFGVSVDDTDVYDKCR